MVGNLKNSITLSLQTELVKDSVGFELRALWLHNRCMLDY
jgi:hypothetical protein